MVISHYGLGMVKIQQGDWIAVFNPIGTGSELEPVKFGADLALVSLQDSDYNGVNHVSRGERVPFLIDGAGEYEVEGNFIQGFSTLGPSGKINTVYLLVIDGVRLVHLGALAESTLSDKLVEALGTIDLLFLPVGGGLLDTKQAAKLATVLEAKVVVPVNFDQKSLPAFLKETGEEEVKSLETWTMKKKDLVDKAGDVVVIKSF